MRTSEQIQADAEDRSPFSNGSEYGIWADRWCYRCRNDNAETETWCMFEVFADQVVEQSRQPERVAV